MTEAAIIEAPPAYAAPITDGAKDALLSLSSLTRRVERSLSGSFTTDTKKAEARELLVQIVKAAWALRRLL